MVLVIKGNSPATVPERVRGDQSEAVLPGSYPQQAYAAPGAATIAAAATAAAAAVGNVDMLQAEQQQQQQSQQGEQQAAPLSPYVLVLLTADRRIDARAVAAHLGVSKNRLRLATQEEVTAVSGFEVGNIPPFGECFLSLSAGCSTPLVSRLSWLIIDWKLLKASPCTTFSTATIHQWLQHKHQFTAAR